MKRILFLFLLFYASLIAKSQVTPSQPVTTQFYTFTTPEDSVLVSRSSVTYNSRGNMLSSISYYWNSYKKKWEGDRRSEYSWDESGNKVLILTYTWIYDISYWIYASKTEYTWDSKKNMTSEISYWWDMYSHAWQGSRKVEYTYDHKSSLILQLDYDWYNGGSGWTNSTKTEIFYDTNGEKTLVKESIWNGGDSYYVKAEYSYNADGKQLLAIVSYSRNPETDGWILFSRVENIYDSAGNMTTEIRFEYNSTFLMGGGTYKHEYTYDADKNMTSTLYYTWDTLTSDWNVRWKEVHLYNAEGRESSNENYHWNSDTNDWLIDSRNEYLYNTRGDKIQSILTYWNSDTHELEYTSRQVINYDAKGNKLSEIYSGLESSSGLWNKFSGTYYTYRSSAVVTSYVETGIFPNPFRDILYIGLLEEPGFSSFELYDLSGRKIVTSRNKVIDLSFLAKGVYIILVKDKDGNLIKKAKVVKE